MLCYGVVCQVCYVLRGNVMLWCSFVKYAMYCVGKVKPGSAMVRLCILVFCYGKV